MFARGMFVIDLIFPCQNHSKTFPTFPSIFDAADKWITMATLCVT